MKFHIATILDEAYSADARDSFERLIRVDRIKAHQATDAPDRADVILFVDLHQQPDDPLLRRLRSHPLTRDHPKKVAVYDERDNPFFTMPGLYPGASASLARRWPISSAPYVLAPNVPDASDDTPDLLFSFRGRMSHPVRGEVLRLRHERARVEDSSEIDFFTGAPGDVRRAAERRYANLLTRSKFVLCPRGVGCSSFRLYETMLAGRVPVVISDAWAPPPFIDWQACALHVAESSVADIPRLLEEHEERWASMAESAARGATEHLAQDARWNYFAEVLSQLMTTPQRKGTPWWVQQPVARASLRVARSSARRRLRGGDTRVASTASPGQQDV